MSHFIDAGIFSCALLYLLSGSFFEAQILKCGVGSSKASEAKSTPENGKKVKYM